MDSYIPPYLCAPDYTRPSLQAQPKPTPQIVAKVAKRRAVARMDKAAKEQVRTRDKEACRVCSRKTREVHERLFKSLGGVASLENSLCLCKICHLYAHAHGFKVFGTSCNGKLTFQMCQAVSHDIFRGRAVPSHVEVIG